MRSAEAFANSAERRFAGHSMLCKTLTKTWSCNSRFASQRLCSLSGTVVVNNQESIMHSQRFTRDTHGWKGQHLGNPGQGVMDPGYFWR